MNVATFLVSNSKISIAFSEFVFKPQNLSRINKIDIK